MPKGPKKEIKKMKNKISYLRPRLNPKFLPVLCFSFLVPLVLATSTRWGNENIGAVTGSAAAISEFSKPLAPPAPAHATPHTSKVGSTTKKSKAKKSTLKKTASKKKARRRVAKKLHIWGTASYARSRDYFLLAQTKSRLYTGLIGLDYAINEKIKVGIYYSNGYNKARTRRTALTSTGRARSDTNSVFVSGSYNFTPDTYLSMSVGYSNTPNHSKVFRRQRPTFTRTKTKTNVFSISPAINVSRNVGNLTVASQLGYAHSNAYTGSTTNSNGRFMASNDNYTDSAFFFADFSYNFKNLTDTIEKIAPFANIGLNHTFQGPKPLQARNRTIYYRSQDSWKAGTGLRFLLANDISINAGWTIFGGHTKQNSQLVSLTVRVGAF